MYFERESVTIKPTSLSVRTHVFSYKDRRYNNKSRENLIRNDKYNGYMSRATATKVKSSAGHLINSIILCKQYQKAGKNSIRYYVNFITLTLSAKQEHDDQYIKKEMLSRFLDDIRSEYGIVNYLWRAEPQKNGNIHFHILIDRYVHHTAIRSIWNKIQQTHGYITRFKNVHGHVNPNSTDIHSAKKIRNTLKYIVKYLTKTDTSRTIKGRIWGSSSLLHNLQNPGQILSTRSADEINRLANNEKVRKSSNDFYDTYFYDSLSELKMLVPCIYFYYVEWLLQVSLIPI